MKERLSSMPGSLNAYAILSALHRHGVRFVVIGGIAGNLHGSTTLTRDLDVCYDRDRSNLDALAAVLRDLRVTLRVGGPDKDVPLPFKPDAQALLNGWNFTFVTKYGGFDCLAEASGGFDHQVLAVNAESVDVGGFSVLVSALDDLIRMKRAAGRVKDRVEVENLSALREVKEVAGRYATLPKRSRTPASRRGAAGPARKRAIGRRGLRVR